MADDVVYQLHMKQTACPYAGATVGKEALRTAFFKLLADWDYLATDVTRVSVEGNIGKAHVQCRYHHIKSGETIDGTVMFAFEVTNGFATHIDEYHDQAKFEAFLTMVGCRGTSETAPARFQLLQQSK